jgi:hypothetical protein
VEKEVPVDRFVDREVIKEVPVERVREVIVEREKVVSGSALLDKIFNLNR